MDSIDIQYNAMDDQQRDNYDHAQMLVLRNKSPFYHVNGGAVNKSEQIMAEIEWEIRNLLQ